MKPYLRGRRHKRCGCALSSRSAASSAWHSSVQSLSFIAFRIQSNPADALIVGLVNEMLLGHTMFLAPLVCDTKRLELGNPVLVVPELGEDLRGVLAGSCRWGADATGRLAELWCDADLLETVRLHDHFTRAGLRMGCDLFG